MWSTAATSYAYLYDASHETTASAAVGKALQ
jgi:hypothetical protein